MVDFFLSNRSSAFFKLLHYSINFSSLFFKTVLPCFWCGVSKNGPFLHMAMYCFDLGAFLAFFHCCLLASTAYVTYYFNCTICAGPISDRITKWSVYKTAYLHVWRHHWKKKETMRKNVASVKNMFSYTSEMVYAKNQTGTLCLQT